MCQISLVQWTAERAEGLGRGARTAIEWSAFDVIGVIDRAREKCAKSGQNVMRLDRGGTLKIMNMMNLFLV